MAHTEMTGRGRE